jgi:hypothetical protein
MIRTMHDLGTDGFSTVLAYMQVRLILRWDWPKLTSSSLVIRYLPVFSLVPKVKLEILVRLSYKQARARLTYSAMLESDARRS